MELSVFGVRATAGTLRAQEGVVLEHSWTDEGVVAGPTANGAQVLHLSVASTQDLERLRAVVDEGAEVPRAIRVGASVTRRE